MYNPTGEGAGTMIPEKHPARHPARKWIDATPAKAAGPNVLPGDQTEAWRTRGFCLVSGVFEPNLLQRLTDYAISRNPAPIDPAAAESRLRHLIGWGRPGERGMLLVSPTPRPPPSPRSRTSPCSCSTRDARAGGATEGSWSSIQAPAPSS